MMPKGFKTKNGYATVTDLEGALDYRRIAEHMTSAGDKMNHATARNLFMSAMRKIAKPLHELHGMPLDENAITETARDPRFQEGVIAILNDNLRSKT
jgi:hypothetical protein